MTIHETRRDLLRRIHYFATLDAKAYCLLLALVFFERAGDAFDPTRGFTLSYAELGQLLGGSKAGHKFANKKALERASQILVGIGVLELTREINSAGYPHPEMYNWKLLPEKFPFAGNEPEWDMAYRFDEELVRQRTTSPTDRALLSRMAWRSHEGRLGGTQKQLAQMSGLSRQKVLEALPELWARRDQGVQSWIVHDQHRPHTYMLTLELPTAAHSVVVMLKSPEVAAVQQAHSDIASKKARDAVEETKAELKTLVVPPGDVGEIEDDVIDAAFEVSVSGAPDEIGDDFDGMTISAEAIEINRKPELAIAAEDPARPKPKPAAAPLRPHTAPEQKTPAPLRPTSRTLFGASDLQELEDDIEAALEGLEIA